MCLVLLAGCGGFISRAETVSPLSARGYTVLPVPQNVILGPRDFRFTANWRYEIGSGVQPNDVALQSLNGQLASRNHLTLQAREEKAQSAGVLRLEIAPHSIPLGPTTDRDRNAVAAQAYQISLAPGRIVIRGNTATGLFYGVQTFVQLLKPQDGSLWLPEGEITDWPDLELRIIYWDDAHHLERMDELERALRQASFYKINGFALKLEGHFQYPSAAPIVEPYALTPVALQKLTEYALRYHLQLIPYLDGPAHDSFILKHPEYANLREYPESNYEFCVTNPATYTLLEGMAQDLLDANRGGKYFVLSTDEPYYVGQAKNSQCDEADRARELGGVGKLLAQFIAQIADYLHARGRRVIFWGEYPLKPEDISALPSYLIDGELYGPEFDRAVRARGIRQMVYISTEGEEPLFPAYYFLPRFECLHKCTEEPGRLREMFDTISQHALQSGEALDRSTVDRPDLMGALVAGWGDAGLHPETFWLGYVTASATAWHPVSPGPAELANSFYRLFYGPSAVGMGRVYRLLSTQAQFWDDSWETVASSARTPIFGNSAGIFQPPRPALDQTLPRLPVPEPGLLTLDRDWNAENARRIALASRLVSDNDELVELLRDNLARVEYNRYNLEVLLSVARLCRQNLEMILDLKRISDLLKSAQAAAARADAARAVADLDEALRVAGTIRAERDQMLGDVTATWYQSWLPRVAAANGRRYLDQVDDVKDHRPGRTTGMRYLVYRELLYPLEGWARRTEESRNIYARAHGLRWRQSAFSNH